jgi:hypothetical protein
MGHKGTLLRKNKAAAIKRAEEGKPVRKGTPQKHILRTETSECGNFRIEYHATKGPRQYRI